MYNLQEYRTIIQGLLVTVALLEDASQSIDEILAGRLTAYNRLELAAFRDDFKDGVERLSTSLVEFRKRALADKIELVKGVNAAKKNMSPNAAGSPPNPASENPSPDPIYCPGCGMLADTFCECGFSDSYRGVA